jgi:hypothetical protein
MWWSRFFRRNADDRVEITALADELLRQLEQLAAEHCERDAREGIVLLADTLTERLGQFAPELRDSAALLAIASLCPVCAARRKRDAERRKRRR